MKVVNRNEMSGKVRWRINSGSGCYHSVPILLLPSLLSEILKSRVYKNS